MAQKRIYELTENTAPDETYCLPIDKSGAASAQRVTIANLLQNVTQNTPQQVAAVLEAADAAEAAALHAVQQVADHRAVGFHPQGHAAGKGLEIRRQTKRHGRKHRNTKRLRSLNRNPLRQDGVSGERQPGMLLDAAERQHAAVVVAQPILDHPPVHLRNAHAIPRDQRSNPHAGTDRGRVNRLNWRAAPAQRAAVATLSQLRR